MAAPDDSPLREVASSFAGTLALALRRYVALSATLVSRPRSALHAGVVDPPVGALGPTELIAWALPPTLALAISVTLSSVFLARGAGGLGIYVVGALTLGIVGGGVAALLVAVLWHPILGLIVGIFGGASDARLRSNAFIAQGAAIMVLAAAILVGTALRWAPIRHAVALPILVAFGAVVLILLVWHAWRARLGMGIAFDVLLVACGLALGVAGWRTAFATQVSKPAPVTAAGVSAELDAASARLRQAQAQQATPPPPLIASTISEPQLRARTSLAEYQRRRDAIDRAVRADTTLFERVNGLAKLYTKLQNDSARVDQELAKAKKGKRNKAPSEHQRDTLLQARTADQVDTIYDLLTKR